MPKKNVKLEEILDQNQIDIYKNATKKQKIWLHEFIHSGDSDRAAQTAYPNATPASAYQLGYRMRLKFRISVQDIYRARGITEIKIISTAKKLLNAKKIKRTYRKGDLLEEEEKEDTYALAKGLEHSVKMLKIDPGKRILHGEDSDNRFASLAEALKSLDSIQQ